MICADGFDPAYLDAGLAAGVLPTMAAWRKNGFCAIADAAMPTFTNPNNMSIVTGAAPAVHGISGNFALDRETGARSHDDRSRDAAQRHDPRADVAGGRTGRRDHRQGQIARDAWPRPRIGEGAICFSSEHADRCTQRRARHRRCRGDGRPREARYVFGRSVAVRARCRHPPRRAGPRAAPLSLAVRLRSARPRAGRARGARLSPGAGRTPRAFRPSSAASSPSPPITA